jgi:2-polyprenyl-3-methyl-5-hydroxy-6-metoxy-1,4-benzoquinol methylase
LPAAAGCGSAGQALRLSLTSFFCQNSCHFPLDTKMKKRQFGFVKKSYETHEDEYRRMEAADIKSWFCRNRPWHIDPYDKHFLEDVFAQSWAPKSGSALELGCGTGPLTRWLVKQKFKTTGVDVSVTAIRMAKKQSANSSIDYRAADCCINTIRHPWPV